MAFLDRIRECNTYEIARFRPFVVAGRRIGWIRHDLAARLESFGEVFAVAADSVMLSRLRRLWARGEIEQLQADTPLPAETA